MAREPHVYRGEALRALAMPLGGLGAGSVALAGDGSLRQWQIHNRVNHLACVPHSFFALWAQAEDQAPVARVLQSSALYHTHGPPAPPTSNDHLVPFAHQALLRALPGVAATEFVGEYPIAELTYRDSALPVAASLQAFSPFEPLNSRDSGLPAVLFWFTVSNPGDRPVRAALAATLQNTVGWDGLTPIEGTRNWGYGGNTNTLVSLPPGLAVHQRTTRLSLDDENFGSQCLACLAPHAYGLAQWVDLGDWWPAFAASGTLPATGELAPSPAGRTWNAALSAPLVLPPGASASVCFCLAWHFPNRHFDYGQPHIGRLLGLADHAESYRVGNHYAAWFSSALEVAAYVAAHVERLTAVTRLARETLYDTTLPAALVEAAVAQVSVLRSPTCFWAQDGRFYGFEGCGGASTTAGPVGCCPLNCTHVWNYEMALARLFPDVERTMRATEWHRQQQPGGELPHRVRLPLSLPPPGAGELAGPDAPALDGLLGAILKTYREYRASGDQAWLADQWPNVRRALHHVWAAHDPAQAGVIRGAQPCTYDVSIYGANPFIGTLYLAALAAGAAMAQRLGETALAATCREVAARGRAALEAELWNGEYYQQALSAGQPAEQSWGAGCQADQLLGQWWAHGLDLGYVLGPERVRRAALRIAQHNFREGFAGHVQQPRVFVTDDDWGLLNCTWPRGGRPAVPLQYSDEVWTGIEYAVAGLLLYEGEPAAALRLVEAVRRRYDGRKQNPWNHIECGDHYVRAMSAWMLLEAATGYCYDAGLGTVAFAPVLSAADFRGPFVAAAGWGTYTQRLAPGRLSASLRLAAGTLILRRLRLAAPAPVTSASALLGDHALPLWWQAAGAAVELAFNEEVLVSPTAPLAVSLALSAESAV